MEVVRSLIRGAVQIRKRLRIRLRRWCKVAALGARRLSTELGLFNALYSPPGELRACPACGGGALEQLEVLRYRRRDRPWDSVLVTGCRTCGLVFANPLPDAEALEKYYAEGSEFAQDLLKRGADRDRRPTTP